MSLIASIRCNNMNRNISYNLQQIWSLKVQRFLFFSVLMCCPPMLQMQLFVQQPLSFRSFPLEAD